MLTSSYRPGSQIRDILTAIMQAVAHIDLLKLAEAPAVRQRHPTLAKAVDRSAAVGSIHEDLKTALASLRAIDALVSREGADIDSYPDQEAKSLFIGALFNQAIVLYARATATEGERPKLLGEAKLSVHHRRSHAEAMKLRNSAVAHYGRGETPEGSLVREAVIMSLFRDATGPKKQVGVYTVRAQNKAGVIARLAALIEVRLAEIADRQQAIFDHADDELDRALRADPALRAAIQTFSFDVDGFCGCPRAADQMRAALGRGDVDDRVYTVDVPRPS